MSKHLGLHLKGIRSGKVKFTHHHHLQNAILKMSNKHFAVVQDVIKSAATGEELSNLFYPQGKRKFDHLRDVAKQLIGVNSPIDLAKKHRETPGAGWGIGQIFNAAKEVAKPAAKATWGAAKTAGRWAIQHPQIVSAGMQATGQLVSAAIEGAAPSQREERRPPSVPLKEEHQAIDDLWDSSDDEKVDVHGGQLMVSDDMWVI